MIHFIKIKKQFADSILSGDKTFEIRKNDRAYQKGDEVKFTVLNEDGVEYKKYDVQTGIHCSHPLQDKVYEITYVLSGWGLKNGYVVFGIKESKESEYD